MPREVDAEWNAWYNTVYVPNYEKVPGVIRGRAAGEIDREVRTLHGDECCLYRFTVALPAGA